MASSRLKRLWIPLVLLVVLTSFSFQLSLTPCTQCTPGVQQFLRCTAPWLGFRSWVKQAQNVLLELLCVLPLVFLASLIMTAAKRRQFWLVAVTVPAVIPAVAFVGPPRDQQPLLWEAPQAQQGRGFKAEKSKEQDEELSKRVRAVAIGSGSGILLSLVVQSITPEAQEPYYYYAEPPRRMAYRRQMLAAPVPPQPPAPSFSFSSLTTGLLVGLGTGVIIGSSMNEMTEGSPEDRKSSAQKPLSKRDSGGDSAAPHALESNRVPMRGRNSQGLLK